VRKKKKAHKVAGRSEKKGSRKKTEVIKRGEKKHRASCTVITHWLHPVQNIRSQAGSGKGNQTSRGVRSPGKEDGVGKKKALGFGKKKTSAQSGKTGRGSHSLGKPRLVREVKRNGAYQRKGGGCHSINRQSGTKQRGPREAGKGEKGKKTVK